ncbi:MAG: hypothetical protein JW734_09285 [Candidatus Omnitrophica bacterium]|nr:hypothetical protein [Candidatus Omnitrophota bacterium]
MRKGLCVLAGALFIYFLFIQVCAEAITFEDIRNMMRNPIGASNEVSAKATIRKIVSAVEIYAVENGVFPSSETDLLQGAYLKDSHHNKVRNGYRFVVRTSPQEYEITAYPEECGVTGNKIISLSSESEYFIESKCARKVGQLLED